MINVAELLSDPDFVQSLSIDRQSIQIATTGDEAGEAVLTHSAVSIVGAVTPLNDPDLLMLLPEGARNRKTIVVYSRQQIFGDIPTDPTMPLAPNMTVDVITWRGEPYKVYRVTSYADYGYYKAVAVIDNREAI